MSDGAEAFAEYRTVIRARAHRVRCSIEPASGVAVDHDHQCSRRRQAAIAQQTFGAVGLLLSEPNRMHASQLIRQSLSTGLYDALCMDKLWKQITPRISPENVRHWPF
jgi:hypothetical protein